jgi:hypothetical protein
VTLEIHGGMEHANDLKGFDAAAEENDVTPFRRNPAPRKQIRALTVTGGSGTDGFESLPDPAKIKFLLLLAQVSNVYLRIERRSSRAAAVRIIFMPLPAPGP